jgi:predicted nucleotide-binding protein
MTTIGEQQFVAHIFAPAEGPRGPAAYAALRAIWNGCGQLYHLTDPIPGSELPLALPEALEPRPGGTEIALAGRDWPGGMGQAILRLHHDVLNLSIGLARPGSWPLPSPSGDPAAPADRPGWWNSYDFGWNLLCEPHAELFLGEARFYLARLDDDDGIGTASAGLYQGLSPLLPSAATAGPGPSAGIPVLGEFALWEAVAAPDERWLRRFVVAIGPQSDPVASTWIWSDGHSAIPPLARYLLHAAKLRYELRVWRRDSQSRQLEAALDSLGSEIARLGARDPERSALLALRNNEAKRLRADLATLRKTVQIAADNMARSVNLTGLLVPGGPLADDADLAAFLLQGLDDEIDYLDLAISKAELVPVPVWPEAVRLRAEVEPADFEPAEVEPAGYPTVYAVERALDDHRKRNVFVVHGRDEDARRALFEFLRALDLKPLQWETLVQETGSAAPSLREAIGQGLAVSTAVIVLMTPDDIVRLHPELHTQPESPDEITDNMQARPNVLVELGMALAVKPDQTMLVYLGEQRPVTDLGDINYVQIGSEIDWRNKIANRLRQAGCPVDLSGPDWLHAGDFESLAARSRAPVSAPTPLQGAPLQGAPSQGAAERGHADRVNPVDMIGMNDDAQLVADQPPTAVGHERQQDQLEEIAAVQALHPGQSPAHERQ